MAKQEDFDAFVAAVEETKDLACAAYAKDDFHRRQFRQHFRSKGSPTLIALAKTLCTYEGELWSSEYDSLKQVLRTFEQEIDKIPDVTDPASIEKREGVLASATDKCVTAARSMPLEDAEDTLSQVDVGVTEGLAVTANSQAIIDRSANGFEFSASGEVAIASSEEAIQKLNEAEAFIRDFLRKLERQNDLDKSRLEYVMLIGCLGGLVEMLHQHAIHVGWVKESTTWAQRLKDSVTSGNVVMLLKILGELAAAVIISSAGG